MIQIILLKQQKNLQVKNDYDQKEGDDKEVEGEQ